MSLKLYSSPSNPRSTKILVAARIANIPVELVQVLHEDLKKKEHIARNPLGKIPVLETKEGNIFESNAILRYIARQVPESKLYGSNPYEAAIVDQWLDFANTELDSLVWPLIVPIFGNMPYDQDVHKKASQELTGRL